jgi:phage terminase large subunit-like protein
MRLNAGQGKLARAEPVAALYEQTPPRVRHVGAHPELEDQLCSYTGAPGERSPDRMDALVHALRELMGLSPAGDDMPVTVPWPDRSMRGGVVPYR